MAEPVTSLNEVDTPRWQFGLRHLFGLTTLAAIAAALASAFGPGTLMASGGIVVAWLNYCGMFARWQTGRRQMVLLCLAWVVWLVSLTLPCMGGLAKIVGWEAAWVVLAGPFELLVRGEFSLQTIWFLAMSTANLLALCLPALVWRTSRGKGQWYGAAICLAMTSTWAVVIDEAMLVGYYVWCASFGIALVASPINRWLLGGMTVATVFWALLMYLRQFMS